MSFTKTASVEELQVIGRFESLRKILHSDQYIDHLKKPLAYWALPADRRLPLAFLGRTLEDLLRVPFAELSGTPGIGQKKISSFVKLLARAANTDPSDLPTETIELPAIIAQSGETNGKSVGGFSAASVSEVVWGQWRASVLKHGLGSEKLGRFAPTLRNMTRVIWSTQLEAYSQLSLSDIRSMKTHGEKRVRAILEVFHGIHVLTSSMGTQEHLVVRIVPTRIDRVEQWIGHALQTPSIPTTQELFTSVVEPLLEQIRNDATQQIANLAENRLGISAPITSVRQCARAMGLTRARVYQLLNEINDIMAVRWPNGRHQMYELREKLAEDIKQMEQPPDVIQFHAAVELLFPGNRRGAAGPLDQAMLGEDEEEVEVESVQATASQRKQLVEAQ